MLLLKTFPPGVSKQVTKETSNQTKTLLYFNKVNDK